MTQHPFPLRSLWSSRSVCFRLFALLVLFSLAVFAAACSSGGASPASRDAALRQIAVEYAQTGDFKQAQSALDKLNLANPGQLLLSVAEADLGAGRAREEVEASARLAEMLGARSQKITAYLAPTALPAQTQAPNNPEAAPTVLAVTVEAPTASPSSSPVPPTAAPTITVAPTDTVAPPTSSPTPEPQNPRVLANNDVNLRAGPGKGYGVVSHLRSGQEAPIIGRNASGDWWQIEMPGAKQAWVAGTVVQVLGAIDTVEVAQNIPALPTAAPRPTTEPQPTAAAAPPVVAKSGSPFLIQGVRLRAVGEGAQKCGGGGDHNIFITVVDAGGAPLDGVRVREVWTGGVRVSGDKGPGRAEFDLYGGGGGQVQVVDEANNPISETTRGLSNTFPDFDLMKAAGYCNCKPHPDDASCAADIANQTYLFAWGHYAYEVVFRRTW